MKSAALEVLQKGENKKQHVGVTRAKRRGDGVGAAVESLQWGTTATEKQHTHKQTVSPRREKSCSAVAEHTVF